MIDPKLFTVEGLLAALLDDSSGNRDKWRKFAEIVPGYMPGFPQPDTEPKLVVRYSYVDEQGEPGDHFLRYSKGPLQGHFWDVYGDDYFTPGLAVVALLQAPVPPFLVKVSEWERWRQQQENQQ